MGLLDDSEPLLRQKLPKVYGLLGGLLGTAPDGMQTYGSILDPQIAARADAVRSGASIGFPIATALNVLPVAGGIFSKFVGSAGGYPSLLKQMGAIDPKGQKQLVNGLTTGGNKERYRLGDMKPAQADQLDNFNGTPARGLIDVFVSPESEGHILQRRVLDQGIAPEKVGVISKQAMRPDSVPMPKKTENDFPTLLSQPVSDGNEIYRAEMPLRQVPDGFEVVSVIPKGMKSKK